PGLAAGSFELKLDQVFVTGAFAKGPPELWLEGAATDPAVGCLIGQVADDAAAEHDLAAARTLAVDQGRAGRHRQPGERSVGHRDVDHLALAAPALLDQCREDPEGGVHRAAAEI